MENVIPGLYASAPEPLSFAPEIVVRAFLIERQSGNLLIYSAGTVAADAAENADRGGIMRHYLNHRHEAGIGCDQIAATFEAPLYCHENDREEASKTCAVAETFSGPHRLDDDFEVIPTPGHTSGATAYLWDSGQHRCLFTGDTVFFDEKDAWRAAVLDSSDGDAYIQSLELIKELDFDVLVPWAASVGHPFYAHTDKADTQRRIDVILERIRGGDDH